MHNSSYMRRVSSIIRRKYFLTDLIALSHNSSKCSACGGINCHSKPCAITWGQIDFSFSLKNSRILFSSFHASTKLVLLSKQISGHRSQRARNLLRQFKDDSVVKSLVTFKWIAFVARHTNRPSLWSYFGPAPDEKLYNPYPYWKKIVEFVC